MYFVIHCIDRSGSAPLRASLLDAHSAYLETQADKIIWAGARVDETNVTIFGSFFIVNVPSQASAKAFSSGDPFTKGGVFERVEISRVRRGIFKPQLAPSWLG